MRLNFAYNYSYQSVVTKNENLAAVFKVNIKYIPSNYIKVVTVVKLAIVR